MGWTALGAEKADEREQSVYISYNEHVPALFTYVCRLVGGDRHKAEDIVQETLLRCWNKFDHEHREVLRPWLFRVARNLVIDGHRKINSRPPEVDGAPWLEQEAAEIDEIERMLSAVVVDDALKALSPAHREVLYQTYFVGLTLEEVARALDVPLGTVKSRLYYGLRALHLAIEERGAKAPPKKVTPSSPTTPGRGSRGRLSRSLAGE
ncbi:sigma-70 family RNA polymerase sigma factor [Streptomyces sp. NBC_00271]|uniref:sigma-70 family RNA polymerase sigma factor n=1 Tax=Streptomyces sp. NBC_00271 TaxID=2975697 RepID=UPI002E29BF1A|nr:sigma-70 family RNA polymerase sigma factor [Streptomyces sp. NBC_00271]